MREVTIVCDYCGESATVASAGTGRPPLFCSPTCRKAARQLQRQADAQAHGAARARRWRAAHPEGVAHQQEQRRQREQAWQDLLARVRDE
jgi:hypothetical protein